MAIDTHCHLNDERYDDVKEVISSLTSNNITNGIVIGYNMESSEKAMTLADENEILYSVIGFHPQNINEITEGDLEKIEKLATNEKVVAIGEIGLDYYWEPYDKDAQKRVFIAQLDIAKRLGLPVVIHQRDCGMDLLEILKEHHKGLVGIILHCFSESTEMAREFIKMGCYISFAGPLTFKNSRSLPDVAKITPKELILSETDCPYLTPHPHRGKRNEPKFVSLVVEKLAELREVSYEEMEKQIEENAKKVFFKMK